MAWRVARSLDTLLAEINTRAPNRSTASDGAIGDASHMARNSDHNAWVPPPAGGVVTARDFTHDPKGGLDCNELAEFLRARGAAGDKRIKYVIWNRKIASATGNWKWRPYEGLNDHTHHLHLSVVPILSQADRTASWGWFIKPVPTKVENEDNADEPWTAWYTGSPGKRVVGLWDRGTDIALLQRFIDVSMADDGYMGRVTQTRVKEYQRLRGLEPDGVVGPKTWGPILRALGVRS